MPAPCNLALEMIGGLMKGSLLQINYSPISNFCLMRLCHDVFTLFLRDMLHDICLVLFFTFVFYFSLKPRIRWQPTPSTVHEQDSRLFIKSTGLILLIQVL